MYKIYILDAFASARLSSWCPCDQLRLLLVGYFFVLRGELRSCHPDWSDRPEKYNFYAIDWFVAVREEPWREKFEREREMRFFGVSEVWKCMSSVKTIETVQKWSKWGRDLPQPTLAVTMESKVWRFVRIGQSKLQVSAFSRFWMPYFCPERPHPLKNRPLEGGGDLNRPSRFQRSQNFWNLFVLGGTSSPNHHLAQTALLTGTTGEQGEQFFDFDRVEALWNSNKKLQN